MAASMVVKMVSLMASHLVVELALSLVSMDSLSAAAKVDLKALKVDS